MRAAFGGMPYAIGRQMSGNGGWFYVRCIRFGLLAASHEKRPDEEIRRATVDHRGGQTIKTGEGLNRLDAVIDI
jgi:hypothetical protein